MRIILLLWIYTHRTSYKDTAVTNGQTYHYYVTAVNDAGESSDIADENIGLLVESVIDSNLLTIKEFRRLLEIKNITYFRD